MRVVFTGFTARDVGSLKSKFAGMADPCAALEEAARRLGHEVRRGWPRPDLIEGADVLVVNYGDAGSMSSRHGPACMALQVLHEGRIVRVLGDANLGQYSRSLRTRWTDADKLAARADFAYGLCPDWIEDVAEEAAALVWAHSRWTEWPGSTCGAHPWGDRELLHEALGHRIEHFIDYSSLMPRPALIATPPRERRWAMAGLNDYDAWIAERGPSWPVERWGPGTRVGMVPESRVLSELYPRCWGVLSPPRGHTGRGSGFFRTRAVHAARAGCVWAGDAGESAPMPESHRASLREVESYRDPSGLARWQAESLAAESWDEGRLLEKCREIFACES